MNLFKLATLLTLTTVLTGCNTTDRLASIGSAPPLTAIADPTTTAGYQPVRMPMPEAIADTYQANSLYRTSARGFFKDERAHRIGDILTIMVTIDDSAKIANTTASSRSASNSAGMGGIFGAAVDNLSAGAIDPSTAIELDSGMTNRGNGSVNRSESLETSVTAVVTQVLPNGNLVIEGRQEVRVNFEVRDLVVQYGPFLACDGISISVKPGEIVGVIGEFLMSSIFLRDSGNKTLATGLYGLIDADRSNNLGVFAAGSIMTAIPVVLLFLYLQKFIVGGITAGGVKG